MPFLGNRGLYARVDTDDRTAQDDIWRDPVKEEQNADNGNANLCSLAPSSDTYGRDCTIHANYRADGATPDWVLFVLRRTISFFPASSQSACTTMTTSTGNATGSRVESIDSLDPETRKQSWLGYLWDTADVGAHERRMLFKVDTSLLLFASVGPAFILFTMETNFRLTARIFH